MKVKGTATRHGVTAVYLALALSLPFCLNASAQPPVSAVCPPVTGPASTAVPVETVVDRDVVYTNINEDVPAVLTPLPAVQAPLDTLKLQVTNRMNSGLLDGKLSNEEADEIEAMLDRVRRQEAEFKLGGCELSAGAVNNLMRKYHMVDQRLTQLLENGNYVEYMPNFELRRAGLQRRIQYHLAAGDLTPAEADQLLAALAQVSDSYAVSRATGGTVTGPELESLHRDLLLVYSKLVERLGSTIACVSPATHDQLTALCANIRAAIASRQFTVAERQQMLDQYRRLVVLQDAIIADDGPRAADIQLLAKEIDSLNFILTRELRDRQVAARQGNRL